MERRTVYGRLPFYYGWVIFLLTLLIYMVMFGLRYSIGIFFTPIQNEFGWSTAVTASVVTAFFWVYAFSAPFMGRLVDRVGVRKSIALGGILLGVGGAMLSMISELWHLYLFWGLMAPVGAAVLYVIPTMGLSKFFKEKRGRAVGWASIGISLSQAFIVPYAALITAEYGWRTAILMLGLMVVSVASLLGYLFFRDNPESMGLRIDGKRIDDSAPSQELHPGTVSEKSVEPEDWGTRDALKTSSFKLILASYFFHVGGVISILTFVVPHMINIGIDPIQAGGAFGLIGAMSALGSFIFGFVSDKIGRKNTIIMTTAGMAASFLTASMIPPNLTLLYGWSVLYGLTYGGCPEQYAAITADHFGSKHGNALFGLLTLGGGFGGGLFPLIGGYFVDVTGNYYTTLKFLGVGMAMATLTILLVKPPARRVFD